MVTKNIPTSSQAPSLINFDEAVASLTSQVPLMDLVHRASVPRFQYYGRTVRIHILDNIKNGHCPEDCGYCAQRKNGNSGIAEYSLKSSEEIFQDAKNAKENGAYRFCMVTSGRGPNDKTVDKLSETIHRISSELGMKVCLSAGVLDSLKAEKLKSAGLDRYNHNLNTSESHYGEICTTHTFQDRINTLEAANQAGIGLCSGAIIGMGESLQDIVQIAFDLKRLRVISIPVNFFIPIAGHAIKNPSTLTPELCVRILSVFRLINPDSEIRIAAGREGHLRSLQSLALFTANSLFAEGYLNVKGHESDKTIQMITDAGFEPEFSSEAPASLDRLLQSSERASSSKDIEFRYSQETIPDLYKFKKQEATR